MPKVFFRNKRRKTKEEPINTGLPNNEHYNLKQMKMSSYLLAVIYSQLRSGLPSFTHKQFDMMVTSFLHSGYLVFWTPVWHSAFWAAPTLL